MSAENLGAFWAKLVSQGLAGFSLHGLAGSSVDGVFYVSAGSKSSATHTYTDEILQWDPVSET